MKILNWIAWISGGIGVLLMLLGFISAIFGRFINPNLESISFFHAANSFFLVTVALFVFLYRCQCKKE